MPSQSQNQSQYQSYSSSSYSSTSFSTSSSSYNTSSSTSTSANPTRPTTQTHHQKSYTEMMTSNDRDGTNIRRVVEETGRPTIKDETYVPAGGRVSGAVGAGGSSRRIEDVTDEEEKRQRQEERDREYEERMEDEYAKREGGA